MGLSATPSGSCGDLMILVFSPTLNRDVDLTRLSEHEAEALRKDMASPLWRNAAPGIRRDIEAALNH